MSFQEGHCSTRPPLFNGTNYTQWKIRMRHHIRSQGFDLWETIVNGPYEPIDEITKKPKDSKDYTVEDKRKIVLNDKAIDILFCALSSSEFNRVSSCETAKEVWDILQVTHEGTSQVKKTRINMLLHELDNFHMKQDETIAEMYKRFTEIVNQLKGLDKKFKSEELVVKILRSLPQSWEPKVTAIEEVKDPADISLDELIGNLTAYEMKRKAMKEKEERDMKEKESQSKRTLALKSREENDEDDEKDNVLNNVEELNFFIKNFNKAISRKYRRPYKGKNRNDGKLEIICYGCNKPGHTRQECPDRRKDDKKKKSKGKAKAYATWSDEDSSSDDSEQSKDDALLCLMAKEDVESNYSSDDEVNISNTLSYDELQNAFDELMKVSVSLDSKNKKLRKYACSLKEENENLMHENEALKRKFDSIMHEKELLEKSACELKNMHEFVKNELNETKNLLNKFSIGTKSLDSILASQRDMFNKEGLGYNKEKSYGNFFRKSNDPYALIKCSYCHYHGHRTQKCPIMHHRPYIVRKVWIPKGTTLGTNPHGPKKVWVPKSNAK